MADDHELVRNAIIAVVEHDLGARVVAVPSDGLSVVAEVKALKPDLLTLDSDLPLVSGLAALGEVRRWSPGTKVAVITACDTRGHLAAWAMAEPEGMLLKTCSVEEMRSGLQDVLDGRTFRSVAVRRLLEGPPLPPLSRREGQILQLLGDGRSNAEIAVVLSISPKTVDNHRSRLMAKLGVHSLGELLVFAYREGLLDHRT